MEIFLNPNLAYLLLVAGGMLAILAVISPGTGMLEIGALFILLLAGWEVYLLEINWWALVLLVLGIIPFALAIRKQVGPKPSEGEVLEADPCGGIYLEARHSLFERIAVSCPTGRPVQFGSGPQDIVFG